MNEREIKCSWEALHNAKISKLLQVFMGLKLEKQARFGLLHSGPQDPMAAGIEV